MLSSPGPLTLFAPSDEAFNKLPKGSIESMLNDIPNLKNVLLFHMHKGSFNPTRNGRTLDSLMVGSDNFPKQFTLKVSSWELEKFIITGQENIPRIVTEGIKCGNGLIHVVDEVLIPYLGNHPPKVTFMGARDLVNDQTLQMSYYGSHEGGGRHGERFDGPDVPFNPDDFPIGDAWKYGGNWKGGIEGDVKYKEFDVKK